MRIATVVTLALLCVPVRPVLAEEPGNFWVDQFARVEPLLGDLSTWLSHRINAATRLRHAPEPADQQARRKLLEGTRIGAFVLPHRDPGAIVLDGEITEAVPSAFSRAMAQRPETTVLRLNSEGGYVWDALAIAREVSSRNLATSVPAGTACYSACAYIYLAGKQRDVEGALGVHQIDGDAETAQFAISDMLEMLDGLGVSPKVISLMLRTPPDDMYVFSRDEIDAFGLASTRTAETP